MPFVPQIPDRLSSRRVQTFHDTTHLVHYMFDICEPVPMPTEPVNIRPHRRDQVCPRGGELPFLPDHGRGLLHGQRE